MRLLFVTSLVAAVGCRDVAPTPPRAARLASTPADASAAIAPEDDTHAGAVPLPGTYQRDASIDHVDATVKLADLPAATATWRTRASLAYPDRVSVALHITLQSIALVVVDTRTETETGYPGSLESFTLGSADPSSQPESGNAFPARDVDPKTGAYVGPVLFAVRILPRPGAPEAERHQYAVYSAGHSILVADKLASATSWTPQLRLDAPRATEFVAIDPGWH